MRIRCCALRKCLFRDAKARSTIEKVPSTEYQNSTDYQKSTMYGVPVVRRYAVPGTWYYDIIVNSKLIG